MANRHTSFIILGITIILVFLYITNENNVKLKLQKFSTTTNEIDIASEYIVDPRTIEHYKNKATQRRDILSNGTDEFHNVLAEEILCPNLYRVGRVGDGGKWMCGPQFIADWDSKCVIYCFGISTDPSFETEINNITQGKCDIVAVDTKRYEYPTEQLASIGAQYIETRIAPTTNDNSITVTNLMKKMNHDHIDILKMDIEGSEYAIASEIFNLKICQMMVELHHPGHNYNKFIRWLKRASAAGYYLIHHEVNIKSLSCVEVSLMHESCLDKFGPIIMLTRFLRHS